MPSSPNPVMLTGSCHCGAITIELPSAPETATSCNCSLCRRLGGVWAYYEFGTVRITGHPQHTQEYVQGDRTLRTIRCATCGCTTHWEPIEPKPGARHGVNLRNFDPRLLESVRVRRSTGRIPGSSSIDPTMFDHVFFGVRDYEASKAFYLRALQSIGIEIVQENALGIEMSADGKTSLCLGPTQEKPAHLHLAFRADNREQVRAFHRAALEAGGRDNGAPGLRPQYHASYYAAFVIDPDGHNIEVVCHEPG